MLFLGTGIVGNRPVTLVTGPGARIAFFAPILHGACGARFALRRARLCVASARRHGSLARRSGSPARRRRFLALRRRFLALRRCFLALRRGNFWLGLLFLLGCPVAIRAPLIGAAPRPTQDAMPLPGANNETYKEVENVGTSSMGIWDGIYIMRIE